MSLLKRIERETQRRTQGPAQGEMPSRKAEMQVRHRPASSARDAYLDLKTRIQNQLIAELDATMDFTQTAEVRRTIEDLYDNILAEGHIVLSRAARQLLFEQIVAAILGLGPLESLLADSSITEIVVNGPKNVYVARDGRLERTDTVFEDDAHLMRIIERIIVPLGQCVDERSPIVNTHLPDGSHVSIFAPPVSSVGPVLIIRRFINVPLESLIGRGTITPEAAGFLKACVCAGLNILITGEVDSGRTAFLGALSSYIPSDERIGVLGPLPLLTSGHEQVISLAPSLAPCLSGRNITMRHIIRNVVPRMRLGRLIIDEVGGREAKFLLEWMATGKGGTLFTVSGSSIDTALAHLEACCLLEDARLERPHIRKLIIAAVNLIVLISCMPEVDSGGVIVAEISEVDPRGMYGDGRHQALTEFQDTQNSVWTRELFKREIAEIPGQDLEPTGLLPLCLERIEADGIHVPRTIFEPRSDVSS